MQAPSMVEAIPHDLRWNSSGPRHEQPRVRGKFLFIGDEKFFVKGATYGTFRPNNQGHDYPDPVVVDRDFRGMQAAGINTVRLYTVPPRWLLDIAQRHGLWTIVGLPWEQHIAFLGDDAIKRSIIERVRSGVEACARHPAVLAYAVGNEIPVGVVRWHGARDVERFVKELCWVVKTEDPDALVTYANFPSTEYLELPFVDFAFFNVYLESLPDFESYVSRLQNLAPDQPLIMGELGFDSRRHGEAQQAAVLEAQVRTAFARGCAGACVFAWTDEWHRGGFDVEDWDFGITKRDRRPKLALDSLRRVFAEVPFPSNSAWPRISVVVCSYNGASTIRDCLDGIAQLEYPDYEVIVVDDGSTDETASIAAGFDAWLISTPNNGLSNARNVGMRAATGEIIAYVDDDARPDPHWLMYLAQTFLNTSHVAVGGPNLASPDDGFVAEAVDASPGNPVHVLLTDELAEHIPGCNMAVRKASLEAIGGFDPQFRVAGDDVDLCWRFQDRGWTIGFSPGAVVWHHRRNSIRGFWRQQMGYGRSEALLERKWPEKYNGVGHPFWCGRVYGNGGTPQFRSRQRIYQGVWGSAAYQSADEAPPGPLESMLTMPEWYLTLGALLLMIALVPLWDRMVLFVPVLTIAMTTTVALATRCASASPATTSPTPLTHRMAHRSVTTFLHLLQPAGRLWGRISQGLTPWRHHNAWGYAWPRTVYFTGQSSEWHSTHERLRLLKDDLRQAGYNVRVGEPFESWDLEVVDGLSCSARIQILVEEHGWGAQFVRFKYRPRFSRIALLVLGFFTIPSAIALWEGAWIAGSVLGAIAFVTGAQILRQAAGASGAARTAVERAIRRAEFADGESQLKVGVPSTGLTSPDREERTRPVNVTTRTDVNRRDAVSTDGE